MSGLCDITCPNTRIHIILLEIIHKDVINDQYSDLFIITLIAALPIVAEQRKHSNSREMVN